MAQTSLVKFQQIYEYVKQQKLFLGKIPPPLPNFFCLYACA